MWIIFDNYIFIFIFLIHIKTSTRMTIAPLDITIKEELNEVFEELIKAREKYHEKVMALLEYKGVTLKDESHIERNPYLYHTLLPEILAGQVIYIDPTEGKSAWIEFESAIEYK
jgi:hypothetical protein